MKKSNIQCSIFNKGDGGRVKGKVQKVNNTLTIPSPLCAMSLQRGFTLIELLAVMLVFGIIGGIAATTLVTTLRSSSKSNIINSVKQNGEYVMTQITKSVHEAYTLTSPKFPCGTTSNPTVTSSITLIDNTNTSVTFSCTGSNPIPPIPANTITVTSGNSSPVSLLDTSSVKTSTCSFTCSQLSESNFPVIGINFSLIQKSTSSFVEQIASASAIPFTTSVIFRNYQR